MREYVQKVKILMESLKYIREFHGKTVVIKLGGATLNNKETYQTIIEDIAMMKLTGINPIVVHGGGVQVSEMQERLGIKPEFINGLRVTRECDSEVTQMVLAGNVNKKIVASLCAQGVQAVGISGSDANLFEVERVKSDDNLGNVGEITKVNTDFLETLMKNDIIPVIAPVSTDVNSQIFNVNADNAVLAVAMAMKAEKLVFLSDVEGVMRDIFDQNSIILHLRVDDIEKYIEEGIVTGGMIVKLRSCKDAIEGGVKSVHILDGRLQHSILLEIFTPDGFGTMVEK